MKHADRLFVLFLIYLKSQQRELSRHSLRCGAALRGTSRLPCRQHGMTILFLEYKIYRQHHQKKADKVIGAQRLAFECQERERSKNAQ